MLWRNKSCSIKCVVLHIALINQTEQIFCLYKDNFLILKSVEFQITNEKYVRDNVWNIFAALSQF